MLVENPFFPLSFIAGPAILTNACAIMQNGAAIRYSLAITQWREFRASLAARDDKLSALYSDPGMAAMLAERRIGHLLRGLDWLFGAVGLFGVTTFLALFGALFAMQRSSWAAPIMDGMVATGALGLLCLLAAMITFLLESLSARALINLHLQMEVA